MPIQAAFNIVCTIFQLLPVRAIANMYSIDPYLSVSAYCQRQVAVDRNEYRIKHHRETVSDRDSGLIWLVERFLKSYSVGTAIQVELNSRGKELALVIEIELLVTLAVDCEPAELRFQRHIDIARTVRIRYLDCSLQVVIPFGSDIKIVLAKKIFLLKHTFIQLHRRVIDSHLGFLRFDLKNKHLGLRTVISSPGGRSIQLQDICASAFNVHREIEISDHTKLLVADTDLSDAKRDVDPELSSDSLGFRDTQNTDIISQVVKRSLHLDQGAQPAILVTHHRSRRIGRQIGLRQEEIPDRELLRVNQVQTHHGQQKYYE